MTKPKLPPGFSYIPDGWTEEVCWEKWSNLSGITREKWEAMERDHGHMCAIRKLNAMGAYREET